MIACIMGNMKTVKHLINEARERLTQAQFDTFANIKVCREMGGNNALLYACSSSNSNYHLVDYLIAEGADPDSMNDYAVNCLLIATKKEQWMMLSLLLDNGVDIGFVDRNGCNALHIASAAGFSDIVEMILLYWSRQKTAAALQAARTAEDAKTLTLAGEQSRASYLSKQSSPATGKKK